MIVFDASVLIAYFDSGDVHHAAAETMLTRAIEDDFGVNPLTLAEVLVGPVRGGRLAEAEAALRDLEVDELPSPADTASRLARLRAETGLRMPDCCVLLAAEDARAAVACFDERLSRAAENRDLVVVGL